MSCKKAQEALESRQAAIKEIVDARKERIAVEAAWKMLREAKSITTARGKKFQTWDPRTDDKAAIMKQAMGPSGNLRAPTLRVKDEFLIGFNPEIYQNWLSTNSR